MLNDAIDRPEPANSLVPADKQTLLGADEIHATLTLFPRQHRLVATWLLLALTGAFVVALAQAWLRGLGINCGCFGSATMVSGPPIAGIFCATGCSWPRSRFLLAGIAGRPSAWRISQTGMSPAAGTRLAFGLEILILTATAFAADLPLPLSSSRWPRPRGRFSPLPSGLARTTATLQIDP